MFRLSTECCVKRARLSSGNMCAPRVVVWMQLPVIKYVGDPRFGYSQFSCDIAWTSLRVSFRSCVIYMRIWLCMYCLLVVYFIEPNCMSQGTLIQTVRSSNPHGAHGTQTITQHIKIQEQITARVPNQCLDKKSSGSSKRIYLFPTHIEHEIVTRFVFGPFINPCIRNNDGYNRIHCMETLYQSSMLRPHYLRNIKSNSIVHIQIRWSVYIISKTVCVDYKWAWISNLKWPNEHIQEIPARSTLPYPSAIHQDTTGASMTFLLGDTRTVREWLAFTCAVGVTRPISRRRCSSSRNTLGSGWRRPR